MNHSFNRGAEPLLGQAVGVVPLSQSMEQQRPQQDSTIFPLGLHRERLRFANFSFTRTPSGQCNCEISLEWDHEMFVGRALGQSSPLGDFRVAAEAALNALMTFAKGSIQFELLGIKQMRAFDENLIIVSISMREAGKLTRLVGCYLADGDSRRGAAVAVLNATNRVLGNYIAAQ